MRRQGMLEEWGDYPRRHAEAEFRRVLRFEDEIEVTIRVERVGRTSISYAWRIAKDGDTYITGRHTIVNVDREGRPESLSEHIHAVLHSDSS